LTHEYGLSIDTEILALAELLFGPYQVAHIWRDIHAIVITRMSL